VAWHPRTARGPLVTQQPTHSRTCVGGSGDGALHTKNGPCAFGFTHQTWSAAPAAPCHSKRETDANCLSRRCMRGDSGGSRNAKNPRSRDSEVGACAPRVHATTTTPTDTREWQRRRGPPHHERPLCPRGRIKHVLKTGRARHTRSADMLFPIALPRQSRSQFASPKPSTMPESPPMHFALRNSATPP
jgi:hypothetical protein